MRLNRENRDETGESCSCDWSSQTSKKPLDDFVHIPHTKTETNMEISLFRLKNTIMRKFIVYCVEIVVVIVATFHATGNHFLP